MTIYEQAIQALADPTRRAVLERLRAGPMPVGELAGGLPVSRPAVSQHLRVLREAGLVAVHAAGTRHYCAIDPRGLAALRAYLESLWDAALAEFVTAAETAAEATRPTAADGTGGREP